MLMQPISPISINVITNLPKYTLNKMVNTIHRKPINPVDHRALLRTPNMDTTVQGTAKPYASFIGITHCSDVTWTSLHFRSPAFPLFVQPFIQAHIKDNIKAPRHLGFVRGIRCFSSYIYIYIYWANYAENVSIASRHHVACSYP